MNCRLVFDEGSLILIQKGQKVFLAGIDEYVPAHIYMPDKGEHRTIPALQLAEENIEPGETVVALNSKGTRIAAIYMNLLVHESSIVD